MSFKPVDPDKTGLTKEIQAEHKLKKLQDGTIELPTKKLYVVDPDLYELGLPEQYRYGVVGEIEFPLDFCPMDSGACTQGGELDGFYRVGGDGAGDKATPELWIHSCYRPTRKWFTGHVKRVVNFKEGYKLPW